MLYDKNNVTMNVHLTRHIANAVRNLGPLWAQSAFALEANNGLLTKTTAKQNVLHSITWKYNTRCSIGAVNLVEYDYDSVSVKGKDVTSLSDDEEIILKSFGIEFGVPNLMTTFQRVCMHKKQFTSRMCKELSTIDYFVKLKGNEMGAVLFHFILDRIVYALIEMYEIFKTTDHLLQVQRSSIKKIYKIKDIERKMIYIKIGSNEILTERPNMYEKT